MSVAQIFFETDVLAPYRAAMRRRRARRVAFVVLALAFVVAMWNSE